MDEETLLKHIKSPTDLIYEKSDGGTANEENNSARPAGTDVNKNISRLSKTIPQTGPEVNTGDENKPKKYAQGGYVGGRIM